MLGDDMHIYIYRYGFPHMGGLPQYERLIIANPIKLDDLGVPPFIFGHLHMVIDGLYL